jgi:two-component system response regulator HydG
MTRSDSRPLILVVDDDPAHRLMLKNLLEDWGYRIEEAEDGDDAVAFIQRGPADLVLMDVRMPRMNGIEATQAIISYNPAVPVLIMTAYSSIPSAVEALKAGAYDYLTKPLDFDALRLTIERALEHTHLRRENEELRSQLARLQLPDMVGRSPAMQQMAEMIALVAPSEATVLLTGESGTGKSLVARAIHANSPRSSRPLVEVNCAAIPESLMESELFGHEKGAFTGADKARRGRFSQADGGTIFLDEVGELSPPMQAKLLRVLQEGDIQRVGSDAPVRVDVRVIAATNRDLQNMVAQETFREDLFYRLNVVTLEVPPLRDRVEDIPVLAEHFLARFAEKNRKRVKGITPGAMDLLLKHPWPGNVRELENVMERGVILLQGDYISEKELPLALQKLAPQPPPETAADSSPQRHLTDLTLAEMERCAIFQTLEETGGNKSEAARRLGITRRTLKLKLKKYQEESNA